MNSVLVATVAAGFALLGRNKRARAVAGTSLLMAAGAGLSCLFLEALWDGNMATTETDWRDVGAVPALVLTLLGVLALFRVR